MAKISSHFGLATLVSEIEKFLLRIRNMAEILFQRRKSSKQPKPKSPSVALYTSNHCFSYTFTLIMFIRTQFNFLSQYMVTHTCSGVTTFVQLVQILCTQVCYACSNN